jgi:malate synthase
VSGVRASRSAWARSYLYVPGSRPDRFASAIASGADVVILDLEDSVAPEAHDTARAHVAALIEQRGPAGHGQGVGSPGKKKNKKNKKWEKKIKCVIYSI